jgi:hypothetical protein
LEVASLRKLDLKSAAAFPEGWLKQMARRQRALRKHHSGVRLYRGNVVPDGICIEVWTACCNAKRDGS